MSGIERNDSLEAADQRLAEETERNAPQLIQKLYNMPNNPNSSNDVQNQMLKDAATRALINQYALNRTGRKSGNLSPMDQAKYARELLEKIGDWASKNMGNRDGQMDANEKQELKEHPTTKILIEMLPKRVSMDTSALKKLEEASQASDQERLNDLDDQLKKA